MASSEFIALHMRGRRFDQPGMPVGALAELAAYRDLVLEVAKELFRADNPERLRVPKGFADRLDLRLDRVEAGNSVLNVLERTQPVKQQDTLMILDNEDDEFDRARGLIERTISAVAAEEPVPQEFPRSALASFDRFGRTLEGHEAVQFRTPGDRPGALYTPSVRRRLLLEAAGTYTAHVERVGRVIELNVEQNLFRLRWGSRAIECRYAADEVFEGARMALEPNANGPLIRADGIAEIDASDNIRRLTEVFELAPAEDAARLEQRLEELSRLENGWYDGEGVAPSPSAVATTRRLLMRLGDLSDPRLHMFPTPDGGIEIEWTADSHARSVEIGATGTYYLDVDIDNGGAIDRTREGLDIEAAYEFVVSGTMPS